MVILSLSHHLLRLFILLKVLKLLTMLKWKYSLSAGTLLSKSSSSFQRRKYVSLTPKFEATTQKMTAARRPVGKPALSLEQKAQREATIDTHMNLPVSII